MEVKISRRNRFRAAMLGTHVGDSDGAPYEWTWTPEQIAEDIRKRGGLVAHEYEPFDYWDPWSEKKGKEPRWVEAGQPTDDSELAAALAMSIVENKGFDTHDAYLWLRSFIIERKSVLTDNAYGTGSTLRAALNYDNYNDASLAFSACEIPLARSNGSLMRCVPIPLEAYPNVVRAMELAVQQSKLTHRNEYAMAACAAFSAMMCGLLAGLEPNAAWQQTIDELKRTPLGVGAALQEIFTIPLTKPDYVRDMGGGYNADGSADTKNQKFGCPLLSLRAALWATIEAKDFADGIVKVIGLGGDTDTYGAIAGGMLGARFGMSIGPKAPKGIPRKWQDAMQGRQIMLDLADRLYELKS